MKKFIFYSLFPIVFCGCGLRLHNDYDRSASEATPDEVAHRIFHGTTNATVEERLIVEEVLDIIREETSGAVSLEIVWDDKIKDCPTFTLIDGDIPGHPDSAGYAYYGIKNAEVIITRESEQYENFFKHVVLHEIVHTLGVDHLPVGLMLPEGSNRILCIDTTTMDVLVTLIPIPNPKPCSI